MSISACNLRFTRLSVYVGLLVTALAVSCEDWGTMENG